MSNNGIDFITDARIEAALDISPMPVSEGELIEANPEPKADNTIAEADFTFARENVRSAIGVGTSALSELATIASQSQRASAYEVVAALMKNIVDSSNSLLELSKKRKDIAKAAETAKPVGGVITNNNLFVGTTQDLQKFLKERKNGD